MSRSRGVQRHSFQLIDGRGVLNKKGLRNFTTATDMPNRGADYAVIAVIGPQSSGKSTFLDHLAGTNFLEMNALRGRNKTTQGIWMSNCVAIQRPYTIAMDIEGTGGSEVFEIKRALFAVAMADILFINLECHDIRRQQASCISLLQTVLQIRIKGDMEKSGKINLCFVLRDITTTPVERLEEDIVDTMKNMWTRIARDGFAGTDINDYFKVQVFGLPNYETQRNEFKKKVFEVRESTLRVHREGVVPGRAFQENVDQLWKRTNDPILNLPAHSDMIAEHMCKYFASMGLKTLSSNKDLMELKKEAEAGFELHSVMEKCASSIRSDSISTLEKKYKYAVAGYITTSLDELQNLTGCTYWASVRKVVRMSTSRDKAGPISNLSSDVATYSEDITLSDSMIRNLKTYARKVALSKLKAEADEKVVERMMHRFCSVMWTERPSYTYAAEEAAGQARAEAMKLLSVMAVAQIDGISSTRTHISELLLYYLLDKEPFNVKSFKEKSSNVKSSNEKSSNELSSNEESSNEQPSKEMSFIHSKKKGDVIYDMEFGYGWR